jgi:hypothetical protein
VLGIGWVALGMVCAEHGLYLSWAGHVLGRAGHLQCGSFEELGTCSARDGLG